MEVEAHHLHLFPPQLLRNREIVNGIDGMQMGFVAPVPGVGAAAAAAFLPLYNQSVPMTVGAPAAAASDSGLTFNNNVINMNSARVPVPNADAHAAVSRKRSREPDDRPALSFLGEDLSSYVQQQMVDIDRLILQHAEKVRMELMERRKRFAKQILVAVEQGLSKRLKAKDEEIAGMTKLNWALQERVKSLYVENQIWRDLAQSNEATANALRNNLEQVLAAQVQLKEEQDCAAALADDAESCCCGDNGDVEGINCNSISDKNVVAAATTSETRRLCRCCQEREPSVLFLPCRHLCVCPTCAPALDACPVCRSTKNGSVNVNMF